MKYQLTADERAFCERVVAAGFHDAKYHTFALVEELLQEGVPGDFAECGVLFGAHPAVMLYVLRKHGVRDRIVHLFDSFQGIPRATMEDNEYERSIYGVSDGRMVSTGVSVSSVENTRNNLIRWGVFDPAIVGFHPGWFEETLAKDAGGIGPLAFLRVDVDLFSSTKTVYESLYPKVVSGGFVCDDDYGLHEGSVTACRRAMESVCGQQDALAVDGQLTTSWWRKR